MSHLHRIIRCLGVIQGIKMNSYTIHTPISSIIRGFACFERFCIVQVYKPKSQD